MTGSGRVPIEEVWLDRSGHPANRAVLDVGERISRSLQLGEQSVGRRDGKILQGFINGCLDYLALSLEEFFAVYPDAANIAKPCLRHVRFDDLADSSGDIG
jgi:hypothetical protein